jgi:hypothetical protein
MGLVTISVGNCLLKYVIESKREGKSNEEDVSSLRKRRDIGILRGSTRSHPVENSLWKRLQTCLKAEYVLNR